MFCKYCGTEIEDDSVFCRECGKKVGHENFKEKLKSVIVTVTGFIKKNWKFVLPAAIAAVVIVLILSLAGGTKSISVKKSDYETGYVFDCTLEEYEKKYNKAYSKGYKDIFGTDAEIDISSLIEKEDTDENNVTEYEARITDSASNSSDLVISVYDGKVARVSVKDEENNGNFYNSDYFAVMAYILELSVSDLSEEDAMEILSDIFGNGSGATYLYKDDISYRYTEKSLTSSYSDIYSIYYTVSIAPATEEYMTELSQSKTVIFWDEKGGSDSSDTNKTALAMVYAQTAYDDSTDELVDQGYYKELTVGTVVSEMFSNPNISYSKDGENTLVTISGKYKGIPQEQYYTYNGSITFSVTSDGKVSVKDDPDGIIDTINSYAILKGKSY